MKYGKEQLAAAHHPIDENLVVVAGAGSGKTRVLQARVEFLVESGIDPAEIGIITFTNAAAAVLQERLSDYTLGYIGTLHGYCYQRARKMVPSLGVISEDESQELLDAIRRKHKATKKELAEAKRDWHNRMDHPRYRWTAGDHTLAEYYRKLAEMQATDYDGLLRLALISIAGQGESEIKALLVDEFQDSTEIDVKIYETMRRQGAVLTVVGDPNQTIYSFRGSWRGGILQFAENVDWTRATLARNYRSTRKVVKAAWNLMERSNSAEGRDWLKKVGSVPVSKAEGIVGELTTPNSVDHNIWILQKVRGWVAEGADPAEIAVLARTTRAVNEIEGTLKAAGIEMRTQKKVELPPEWKLLRAMVAMIAAPLNWRIAEMYGRIAGIRLDRGIADLESDKTAYPENFYDFRRCGTSQELLDELARKGIPSPVLTLLKKHVPEWRGMTLEGLQMGLSLTGGEIKQSHGEGVTVRTIHSSKGLEWDKVIVAAFEEGVLPLANDDVEEERRVAYVAITRAREECWLVSARERRFEYNEGFGETKETGPSRFIDDIFRG